jgi:nitrite reductase/ring-hydroxylating ferredoxin subunit
MSANPVRRFKIAPEQTPAEGAGTVVNVADTTLALFRIEGQCYALANACPHKGGPLGEGDLKGYIVTCPWHGWTWDVRTGTNARMPALKKVACFPVIEENGELFVELD